jgi:Ser/Thr protein kinase RdoA (MazF antagonist)
MALLDDLVQPFTRVDEVDVVALLRDAYGLEPRTLTRLDTERDDTFRVDLDAGVVLAKVAHPADAPELLELQDAALEAAHDLPVPVLRRTLDGRASAALDDRLLRVLSWVPGEIAGENLPLAAGGALLGRLSAALRDVDLPAGDRLLAWDLRHVPALAEYTDEPLLVDAIARFAAEISPDLDAQPRQLVHNDFHPWNVLIDASGEISGVLDFGDVVRTPRVCDVGVALGYLIPDDGPGAAVREAFVAGFESVVPLTEVERRLLPGLVAGRELQRIIINEEERRLDGESPAAPRLRRLLARALEDWQ